MLLVFITSEEKQKRTNVDVTKPLKKALEKVKERYVRNIPSFMYSP